MRAVLKAAALLVYGFLMYMVVFGVMVFAVYQPMPTDIDYDVETLRSPADETAYVHLVEERTYSLDVRLALVEAATTSIDFSTYAVRTDRSRDIVYGALLEAADRGVKVRLVIDASGVMGFYGENTAYVNAMASHPNITLVLYEPLSLWPPYAGHNRLHDKLWVVDERYGMVGGRNIGDRYFLESMPAEDATHDRDILVFGEETVSAVAEMRAYFDEMIDHRYTRTITRESTDATQALQASMIDDYHDYIDERALDSAALLTAIHDEAFAVGRATFVRSPLNRMHKTPVLMRTIVALSEGADDIFVQTPYFVLDRALRQEIAPWFDQNLTVLTNNPATNPNIPGMSGYLNIRNELAGHWALYEYQGTGSLHMKTVLIDNDITVIGSLNIDPRSAFLSTESAIVVYSEPFNAHVRDTIDNEYLAQSLRVLPDGDYASGPVEPIPFDGFQRAFATITRFLLRFVPFML